MKWVNMASQQNFYEIFKNAYFEEHLRTTASKQKFSIEPVLARPMITHFCPHLSIIICPHNHFAKLTYAYNAKLQSS